MDGASNVPDSMGLATFGFGFMAVASDVTRFEISDLDWVLPDELMESDKVVSSAAIAAEVDSRSVGRSPVCRCCSDGDCFVASAVEKKKQIELGFELHVLL